MRSRAAEGTTFDVACVVCFWIPIRRLHYCMVHRLIKHFNFVLLQSDQRNLFSTAAFVWDICVHFQFVCVSLSFPTFTIIKLKSNALIPGYGKRWEWVGEKRYEYHAIFSASLYSLWFYVNVRMQT